MTAVFVRLTQTAPVELLIGSSALGNDNYFFPPATIIICQSGRGKCSFGSGLSSAVCKTDTRQQWLDPREFRILGTETFLPVDARPYGRPFRDLLMRHIARPQSL